MQYGSKQLMNDPEDQALAVFGSVDYQVRQGWPFHNCR